MIGFKHLALRQTFNKRLTLAILLIAVSQFNFGFDTQGYSATMAMEPFIRQFGRYNEDTQEWELPPVWLSFFNGFNYLGQATGLVVGSIISRRFGRRMCMFAMSIWGIVAAIVVITASHPTHILVGRVINYVYIGMELSVVPIYQAELTPREARGFVVATYQTSLYAGGLVMQLICRGTSTLDSSAAYRIPYGMFFVVPTFVACAVLFIPESPRWLVLQDRREEALKSLRLIRDGKFTDEQIEEEMAMISHAVRTESNQLPFINIFLGSNAKRTIIVVGVNIFMQSTGQIFAQVYGALFVRDIGTVNPFSITVTIAAVNLVTAVAAMFLIDKVGRRTLILTGATIQTSALMVMGGLGTVSSPSSSIMAGIIAMMVVFIHGYSLGWAPGAHLLSSEIPNLRVRDMTYRTASLLNIATQFACSFSMPYLLYAPYANLGARVGFVFGSIAAVSIVFAFFMVPNCAGRSLEQIDILFQCGTPLRKFHQADVGAIQENFVTAEQKEHAVDAFHVEGAKGTA